MDSSLSSSVASWLPMLLVHHLLRLLLHMFDPPMLLLLPHMLHIGQLPTGTVLTTDQLRKLEVWRTDSPGGKRGRGRGRGRNASKSDADDEEGVGGGGGRRRKRKRGGGNRSGAKRSKKNESESEDNSDN